eukprot:3572300-Rhodomonas_salina.2
MEADLWWPSLLLTGNCNECCRSGFRRCNKCCRFRFLAAPYAMSAPGIAAAHSKASTVNSLCSSPHEKSWYKAHGVRMLQPAPPDDVSGPGTARRVRRWRRLPDHSLPASAPDTSMLRVRAARCTARVVAEGGADQVFGYGQQNALMRWVPLHS